MRTALGYVRVSTDEQPEHGLGLEAQRPRVRSYREVKGLHVVVVFEDPALSGGKHLPTRPAGSCLLAETRCHGVCLARPSRFEAVPESRMNLRSPEHL
jgi:site-specific DNA recombinase